jgi:hypothetical protein
MFLNLPVRRRLVSAADAQKALARIQALALMHPAVHFSVTDAAKGVRLLHTRVASSARGMFAQIFEPALADALKRVSHRRGAYTVEGYLCPLDGGVSTKSYQFLYVSKLPVVHPRCALRGWFFGALRALGARRLSKFINGVFQLCQRRTFETDAGGDDAAAARAKTHPAFILNVECDAHLVDTLNEPGRRRVEFRELAAVFELFHTMLAGMLTRADPALAAMQSEIFAGCLCQPRRARKASGAAADGTPTVSVGAFLQPPPAPVTAPAASEARRARSEELPAKKRKLKWNLCVADELLLDREPGEPPRRVRSEARLTVRPTLLSHAAGGGRALGSSPQKNSPPRGACGVRCFA